MKNILTPATLRFGFTASLLFGVALLIGDAQTGELKASVTAPPVMQSQSQQQSEVKTFTGKILSQNGGRFILRESTSELWYHLDDQQQAGKFLGKNVLVTGVLDGLTDTIRVRSITDAKA
jgi:hypothetical protein